MAEYREVKDRTVIVGYIRARDGVQVPWPAPGNMDADEIREWLADGGVADPATVIPPITSVRLPLDREVTTTTNAPTVLLRYTVPPLTAFDIQLTVIAIDTGNGNRKKWRREGFIGRLGAASGPVVVGAITNPLGATDPADAGAAGWTMTPGFQGNDLVLTAVGPSGREVAWSLFADVRRFTQGGV